MRPARCFDSWMRSGLTVLVSVALVGHALASVSVSIHGLESSLESNVRATLSIARVADDASDELVQRLHSRARAEILRGLEPFGHYSPTIETRLDRDGDDWAASYRIEAGPRVRVAAVDLQITGEGGADSGFLQLRDSFPVRPKDPLLHADYESGKRQLMAYAARKGYFDARFDTTAIVVSVQQSSANVIVHLDSGPRYQFGPVELHQNVLDERMLIGYVQIKPGEPYDTEPLIRMQDGLSTGPYFNAVEVHPRRENAQNLQIPIDVLLLAASPQRYEVGAGYGTDTGLRGKLRGEWRRLNRSGHYAEAELNISQIEYSASSKYTIPWPYPRTEQLSFFAGAGLFDPNWAQSWRLTTGVNLGHTRRGWREVASLAYEHEEFTIADEDGVSTLIIPGLSWSRTRADDLRFTKKGRRIRFDISGAHTGLLSTVTFGQLRAEAKVIISPLPRTRLLGRASAGKTFTDEFNELPPTQRFVTGGDQTIRGYEYDSLGPTNDSGDIIGGNSLALAGIEADFLFTQSLGWAAFLDSGNALDDFQGKLAMGAGTGFRWISPIGTVRLDGAFAVSEDNNFRLHITIGPDL